MHSPLLQQNILLEFILLKKRYTYFGSCRDALKIESCKTEEQLRDNQDTFIFMDGEKLVCLAIGISAKFLIITFSLE